MSVEKLKQRSVSWMALAIVLAIGLSSCARRTALRVNTGHPASAKVVVVKKGHKHTARCGHYRHNGRWYFIKGHHHQKGCGHHFAGGVWVFKI